MILKTFYDQSDLTVYDTNDLCMKFHFSKNIFKHRKNALKTMKHTNFCHLL